MVWQHCSSRHYVLSTLLEENLDREVISPTLQQMATVQRRLVGIINEGLLAPSPSGRGRGVRGFVPGPAESNIAPVLTHQIVIVPILRLRFCL